MNIEAWKVAVLVTAELSTAEAPTMEGAQRFAETEMREMLAEKLGAEAVWRVFTVSSEVTSVQIEGKWFEAPPF